MDEYIDGYVLTVSKDNLEEYKKMAAEAGKMWIKHGALKYVESVADDFDSVKEFKGLSFEKLTDLKENETVIFAFVVYKNKEHRDEVNKKVMEDPSMKDPENKNKPMPFELSKMAYAGFKTIVNLSN